MNEKVNEGSEVIRPDLERACDRRRFITGTSAALAAIALSSRQATAQDVQKVTDAQHGESASDPGPENNLLREASPNSLLPPPTDRGEVPSFWNSFSEQHRRVQPGGWSRQVTVADFPVSKDIAGVNMRLTAGGIRELHWHDAAEWAVMLTGAARITALDNDGKSFVQDVQEGDLWYFPSGNPHSIQGLGPDGAEFLLVFDDGKFSEANTTLISDWTRHTPREVLAKNWGVPESTLDGVYSLPQEGLYIFQEPVPPPLGEDQAAAAGWRGASPVAFSFPMHQMPPTFRTKSGEVRIIDSKNFPVATTIAAAHVIIKPGGMRELHWHQNAEEWQYYIKGQGRMTVFFNGGKARTADFAAGDVGLVPRTFGHYIENTGNTDLVFLEMFKANRYRDLSLSEWVRNSPPELMMQHLRISQETLEAIPNYKAVIVPV
ncbi:MAG TPA: cupin domain-containing protein [Chthoniobacterales bacterium]|nr:cupin domain-containing protein [Chthoniobacterales bacterium]